MNGYILHVNIMHQKEAASSAFHFPFHKQRKDLTTNLIKLECFPGLMQQAAPHAVAAALRRLAGAPGNRNSSDAAWLTLPPPLSPSSVVFSRRFFLLIAFHLLNSILPPDGCIEISSSSSITSLVSFKVRSYDILEF